MYHKNLFIVDNSKTEWSVKKYLNDWCQISEKMDIATGYFEIGALLELDGEWQKLNKIRILLGDEVTKRTQQAFQTALENKLKIINDSLDTEKEKNEFLIGVEGIVEALRIGQIECRVYKKDKFHAKAYITYMKCENYDLICEALNISKDYALVGSSNFTRAGLNQNIELNVQIRNDVNQLQDWFEDHWNEAEDVSLEVLKVIEKHRKEYSPYEVYVRSMYEYFKGQEQTISEWEKNSSQIYPILSQYQKDGYYSLINIANKYRGAFLCDGVGLGKTFIGLMLIERFVKKERKNVVLVVPASARISVWEATIKKFIPEILDGFYSFKIINHTDLLRENQQNLMQKIAEQAECIVMDEAHHFRNRASNRYRKLYDMIGQGNKKQLFMLTATPINNSFLDLQHLIELFTQREDDFFKGAPLGIHSLKGHFKKMESQLVKMTSSEIIDACDASIETDIIFKGDALVNELVVQRSRAYVKKSLLTSEGENVLFPIRKEPTVANFSLKKSYGRLIEHFIDSFYRKDKLTGKIKPILNLAVYSPYGSPYFIGDITKIDMMKQGRQMQVVNLIRQLLLKRFESSSAAFEETCIRIFIRLLKFLKDYGEQTNIREIDNFLNRKERIIKYAQERYVADGKLELDEAEDDLPQYVWDMETDIDIDDFDIKVMLEDTINDLEILATFIDDLMSIDPQNDDKLRELKNILTTDDRMLNKKVIIFTEYKSTAKYIYRELNKAGFKNLFEIDGQTKIDRKELIERFAPYYNDKSSVEVEDEIQILISTDVLAEGLNLQDATCLINYELHWNPVRLMQRIGRVDRRRNKMIEDKLLNDHPELKAGREFVYYWNFLPPDELEKLLSLYHTVSKKALRISKTFGIEGKQLLTPNDDYEALKEFNSAYEGVETEEEEMILEYQKLMVENPNYDEVVRQMPIKIFSGKSDRFKKGIFFCYELPMRRLDSSWTNGDGFYKWYMMNLEDGVISDNMHEIWQIIKSDPQDERFLEITEDIFNKCRKRMETYINKNYMRNIQAPLGVKPRLVTWMQMK